MKKIKRKKNRITRKRKGWKKKKVIHSGKKVSYVRGQPRRTGITREKALKKGLYGCGTVKAKEACQACGVMKRVLVGKRTGSQLERREQWRKENILRGSDRKRKEKESISRHRKRGTVRGMKMRRGLPVRGQRTSTNGITARTLNRERAK